MKKVDITLTDNGLLKMAEICAILTKKGMIVETVSPTLGVISGRCVNISFDEIEGIESINEVINAELKNYQEN